MADNGKKVLGIYSAACETIRGVMTRVASPEVGDIIFFRGSRHSGANHIGIIYKVANGMVYTIEGNTSGASGVVDNGGGVAAKSYSLNDSAILSYGRPKYSNECPLSRVVQVAAGEVGYLEKASNSQLDSKTGNAGKSNYTKYGKWIGANGDYWCASFVSWCFHAAYDSSSGYVFTGNSGAGGALSGELYNLAAANSSLATYVNRLTSTECPVRDTQISKITIHIARKVGDIYALSDLLTSSRKCYNYGIANDGTIGLFVDENKWTDSSNNNKNDKEAVNIICMNETLGPDYKISTECEEALIALIEDICRRNFIYELGHISKDGTKTKSSNSSSEYGNFKRFSLTDNQIKRILRLCAGEQGGDLIGIFAEASLIANLYDRDKHGNYSTDVDVWLKNNGWFASDTREAMDTTKYDKYVTTASMNKVRDVFNNGRRGFPNYIDEHDTVSAKYASEKGFVHEIKIDGTQVAIDKSLIYDALMQNKDVWIRASATYNGTWIWKYKDSSYSDPFGYKQGTYNSYSKSNNIIYPLSQDDLIQMMKSGGNGYNYLANGGIATANIHNVTFHNEFNPKSECPGKYIEENMQSILTKINQKLSAYRGTNQSGFGTRYAMSDADALRLQSVISIKSIHPYVIQPAPNELNINYDALRDQGVIATMLDAGERFNAKHERVKYRTETIYKQSEEALKAKIPHSYIYTTRAKDVKEVREEAYWFYFVVSKYPPKLGIFLKCQFDVEDKTAEDLVERWYEFFVDWGFKSKCGLYCTKEQAKKIGWPKQCKYLPMWLGGEMTDTVCPDSELLTPSFFALDNLANSGYDSNSTSVITTTIDQWERYNGSSTSSSIGS